MKNVENIEAKLGLVRDYEHKVIGNKMRIDQVTSEYNVKLKEIKNIINENAFKIYPMAWIINETNQEKQELIAHYFNLLKQDIYIITFNKNGLEIKTNEIKHEHTYPKVPVLIKEYLTIMYEKFVTHAELIKKVNV